MITKWWRLSLEYSKRKSIPFTAFGTCIDNLESF